MGGGYDDALRNPRGRGEVRGLEEGREAERSEPSVFPSCR